MSAISASAPVSMSVSSPTMVDHGAMHDGGGAPATASALAPAATTASQATVGAAAIAPTDQQALLASLLGVLTNLVGLLQAQSGADALGGSAAPSPLATGAPSVPATAVAAPTSAPAQTSDDSLDGLWTQAVQQSPPQAPVAATIGGGAAPQLHGAFQAGAKATSGTASVVSAAGGGKRLDISGLKTDAGPDLHVYLAANHPTSDAAVTDYVDLGKLPTNVGDSQLAIPPGTDLSRYNDVVIWCAMAKTTFGSAQLG